MALSPVPVITPIAKDRVNDTWAQWFSALRDGVNIIRQGVGNPNSAETGSPGDVYLNLSGGAGATLWIKESGVKTDTGWVAK